MRTALGLAMCLLVALPARALASPTATLKQKNSELSRLLKQKPEPGSPAEKKQKEEIKALASTLFDYGELAKRSLAAHWDKLSRPQQEEFVSTLRELIERNYVRTNLDYQVLYQGEQLTGDEATVQTVVKAKSQGKATDIEVVYKLRHVGERWLVYDLITDEVSLLRNYRTQFNKIISEKSYDELIRKMRSKLKDGEGT